MRATALLVLATAAACAGAPQRRPCEYLFGAMFEFIVSPEGMPEHFAFIEPRSACEDVTARVPSLAWRKTACIMFVLERRAPTYQAGESPRKLYSYFIYNSDRPDAVFRDGSSGTTRENPIVYVRDEVLHGPGSEKDGSALCDGDLEPHPAQQGAG